MSFTNPNRIGLDVLPVSTIRVDISYQRPLDSSRVAAILKAGYNPYVAEEIRVVRRTDSLYYCVDGQHRLEAAIQNGLDSIACWIYEMESVEEEAYWFGVWNKLQKAASVNDIHHAGVRSGESQRDMDLENALREAGFYRANVGNVMGLLPLDDGSYVRVNSMGFLTKMYDRMGRDHVAKILSTISLCFPGQKLAVNEAVVEAMSLLLRFNSDLIDISSLVQVASIRPEREWTTSAKHRKAFQTTKKDKLLSSGVVLARDFSGAYNRLYPDNKLRDIPNDPILRASKRA